MLKVNYSLTSLLFQILSGKDPIQIIEGNEKVVRPRLSDAEFFFLQDQKQPLASRKENFHKYGIPSNWGTLWNKSERIAKLALALSPITGANAADAEKQLYWLNVI